MIAGYFTLLAMLWFTHGIRAQDGVGGAERRYACWGSFGPPVVSAQCPRSTVLHVLRAGLKVRGRGNSGAACTYMESDCGCVLGEMGCQMPDVRQVCMGRPACRLDVTQQYINTDRCRGFSDYMYIEFKCVPESESQTIDICSNSNTAAGAGYIQSPGYPGAASLQQQCQCRLTSSAPVSVNILDFNNDAKDCQRSRLDISLDGDGEVFCQGGSVSGRDMVASSGKVTFTYQTNGEASTEGFWIRYQSNENVDVQCRVNSRTKKELPPKPKNESPDKDETDEKKISNDGPKTKDKNVAEQEKVDNENVKRRGSKRRRLRPTTTTSPTTAKPAVRSRSRQDNRKLKMLRRKLEQDPDENNAGEAHQREGAGQDRQSDGPNSPWWHGFTADKKKEQVSTFPKYTTRKTELNQQDKKAAIDVAEITPVASTPSLHAPSNPSEYVNPGHIGVQHEPPKTGKSRIPLHTRTHNHTYDQQTGTNSGGYLPAYMFSRKGDILNEPQYDLNGHQYSTQPKNSKGKHLFQSTSEDGPNTYAAYKLNNLNQPRIHNDAEHDNAAFGRSYTHSPNLRNRVQPAKQNNKYVTRNNRDPKYRYTRMRQSGRESSTTRSPFGRNSKVLQRTGGVVRNTQAPRGNGGMQVARQGQRRLRQYSHQINPRYMTSRSELRARMNKQKLIVEVKSPQQLKSRYKKVSTNSPVPKTTPSSKLKWQGHTLIPASTRNPNMVEILPSKGPKSPNQTSNHHQTTTTMSQKYNPSSSTHARHSEINLHNSPLVGTVSPNPFLDVSLSGSHMPNNITYDQVYEPGNGNQTYPAISLSRNDSPASSHTRSNGLEYLSNQTRKKGPSRGESITVTIIAACVIGSILLIVIIGIVVRFVINRADPHYTMRQNHKKECVIRRNAQLQKRGF